MFGGILHDFVVAAAQVVGHLLHLLVIDITLIPNGIEIHHCSQVGGYVCVAV